MVTCIIVALLLVSCKHSKGKNESITTNENSTTIVTTVISDTSKWHVESRNYPIDTILNSGWSIKYSVKNDSTKDKDLYINCSKNGVEGIYNAEDVLLMRKYFIPKYIGESRNCIFFKTACATNCKALLVFHKIKKAYKLYSSIIDYSIKDEIIVFINDFAFTGDLYSVSVSNLKLNQLKIVKFKNHCNLLPREGCIDSVRIVGQEVKLYGTLNEGTNYYKDKVISEIKTIHL